MCLSGDYQREMEQSEQKFKRYRDLSYFLGRLLVVVSRLCGSFQVESVTLLLTGSFLRELQKHKTCDVKKKNKIEQETPQKFIYVENPQRCIHHILYVCFYETTEAISILNFKAF